MQILGLLNSVYVDIEMFDEQENHNQNYTDQHK